MNANEFRTSAANSAGSQWLTAREFAQVSGVSLGVLGNWRSQDKSRGYIAPGRPRWRTFGGAIRYWRGDADLPPTIGPELLGPPRPRRAMEAAR